jgi:hypothetical protein
MTNLDFEVYDGKTFRDLCKEVVTRSQSKKDQIDLLITDVRTLIKNTDTAIQFLPRLKDFLEAGIKNDEQIIKLAAVLQRLQSTQIEASGGENGLLTEEEKEELRMNSVDEIKKIVTEVKFPIDSKSVLVSLPKL